MVESLRPPTKAADYYVRNLPLNYTPHVFKNTTQLENFLDMGVIANKSNRSLTSEEIELLSLGLDFVPEGNIEEDWTEFQTATSNFKHSINSHIYFAQNKNDIQRKCDRIVPSKPKLPMLNNWQPPSQTWEMSPEIRREISGLRSELSNLKHGHLPVPLRNALTTLANDPKIYVMPADKGGCLVIWDKAEYLTESRRQLENSNTYRELTEQELTKTIHILKTEIGNLTKELFDNNYITDKELSNMRESSSTGSAIYFLPKIHKPINSQTETFSGRPIVATHSSPTKSIDVFITELTKPLLRRIPGSLLDTLDLLNSIPQNTGGKQISLITADVNSLYPSIPWKEGEDATVEHYSQNLEFLNQISLEKGYLKPPTPELFRTLLKLVLQNSLIHHQGKRFFHQVKGTAMGCNISVYFANCYMYSITRQIIENPPPHVRFFARFIDDILLFTTGSAQEITDLFLSISNEHISYTIEEAKQTADFLDVTIYFENNTIHTKTYKKPTSIPFYLHAKSAHPNHLINSIPYAQILRLKRCCSKNIAFLARKNTLFNHLSLRGYPDHILKQAFAKSKLKTRENLLKREIKPVWTRKLQFKTKYTRHFNWTNLKSKLESIKSKIINHYNDSFLVNSLKRIEIDIVHTVGRSLGSYFSKSYKNPNTSSLDI